MDHVPRVVLFGSGSPWSAAALEKLSDVCNIVAVVTPDSGLLSRFLGHSSNPLHQLAARKEIPTLMFSSADRLRASNVDLFCVATFPRILNRELLSIPRIGVLNVHPSLLPRHRGVDPLFWTYFYDEPETGVTVHWMTETIDGGDIVLQQRMPVPRGLSGYDLYRKLASDGSRLLARAVVEVLNRTATQTPQNENLATRDPSPVKLSWQVPYDEWPAERLWHFLRGVMHMVDLPLRDRAGRHHFFLSVEELHCAHHDHQPGDVIRNGPALVVYTRDGWVRLRARPFGARVRSRLRRMALSL